MLNDTRALILAAGKGTRMGEIGKILPKVLWPIYEKTLLELQVLYAKSLGIKEIFINVYYHQDQILKHINESSIFKDVKVLIESEVLDVGGAIHNLGLKHKYKGRLLVLNSDQFYMINNRLVETVESLKINDVALFTYPVETRYGYNTLSIEGDQLKEIILKGSPLQKNIEQTYTGISIVNLEKLQPVPGKSSFFESVANYKLSRVACILQKDEEYWDFGTLERYYDTSFLMNRLTSGLFYEFITKYCIRRSEVDRNAKKLIMSGVELKSREITYQGIKESL